MSGVATDGQEPVTRVFGIRHHGPGSARSLAAALRAFAPDTILIEGPADADPLTAFVADADLVPPVALLAYVPGAPERAAFWPFAAFSPEWQALRHAVEYAIPVRFCDLPATQVLARGADSVAASSGDPLGELAAAGGYDDAERWWDAIVESRPGARDSTETTPYAVFDALTEAMAVLRGDAPTTHDDAPTPGSGVVDAHTLRREAHMRQTMRSALKAGSRRLAVVCGAWHAPALAGPLGPAAPDKRLLTGAAKVKATLTWVPWTHSRLSVASGYGAGITSPGWYQHLFTDTEAPVARWLTKVAGVLRAQDLPVSSAHVIEAVRLAETLAALRDRPLAGLSEVTEAVRSVMCGGEETLVRLVVTELVEGEALGTVPDGVPTVPLDADLRALTRSLRMKRQPRGTSLDLDLRQDNHLEKSRLLHRLRLLGIDWGVPTEGQIRTAGTFRESWELRWRPEFAVAVIEASRWGQTVRQAARAKLLDTTDRSGISLAELGAALDSALLADLGDATDALITRLASVAAMDHDVTHLLSVLPRIVATLRYGDVRGTDTAALARLADGLLVRIHAGLPGAVTGLDAESAAALRDLIDAAHSAVHLRGDPRASELWTAALTALADRTEVQGGLVGRAVRLLTDAGTLDEGEAARRFAAALSVGSLPAAEAAWIDGFLGGRGLLLVHDHRLLRLIDTWLTGLDDEQFVRTLPLLRRTFGGFEPGERRGIGTVVRDIAVAPSVPPERPLDTERGLLALRTVADILGVSA